MTELGRPPIDPFSDVQWARVERRLWERLDDEPRPARAPMGRRTWLWAAIPAAAAVAIVIAVVIGRGDTGGSSGELARVVAGPAPSSVTFGDVFIELDASSAVQASSEHTIVDRGGAWFTVAPRGDRPAFVVDAGEATVRVIGTRFRVSRDGDHVSATVDHGIVDVTYHGAVVRLVAGQRWSSRRPDVVADVGGASPLPAPPPPRQPPPVTPDPPTVAPDPPPVAPAHPHHDGPVVDTERAQFEHLAAVEPRDPDAAITGYLAIAGSKSKWAEPALYAAGRIAFDHHDRRADTLLSLYLKRFPRGGNVIDVQQLLVRLQGGSR